MRKTTRQKVLTHLTETLEILDLINPLTLPKFSRFKLALAVWELQRVLSEVSHVPRER